MIISIAKTFNLIQYRMGENTKDYNWVETGDYKIFIYGYPYILGAERYRWANPIDIVKLYKQHSLSFVDKIDGVFFIVIYSKRAKTIYLITDCYGLYSPFYYNNEHTFYIFDSIENVLPYINNLQINKQTVYESLITGYGFRCGAETHIKNIFSFTRGSIYTLQPDKEIDVITYWDGLKKQDVTVQAFNKFLHQHLARGMSLSGKKVLTLSGGYDTSTVLCSVLDHKFQLTSFGMKHSVDLKSAKRIAHLYDKELTPYVLDRNFVDKFIKVAEKHYNIYNGLAPHIHYIQFLLMVAGEAEKSDILYLGFLGDEIWRLCDMSASFLDRFSNQKILDTFTDPTIMTLPKRFNDEASTMNFLIDSYAASFGSNLVKLCGKHMKVFMGLINKDILEKLNSNNILWKDRISGKIQLDFIKQHSEQLYQMLRKIKKINPVKIYMNRICRKFFHKNLFTNYPNRPHTYDVWLRKYHSDYIKKVFFEEYEKLSLKKLFHKTELQNIVKSYLRGNDNYFAFIIAFLSLEIWFKNIINTYLTVNGELL